MSPRPILDAADIVLLDLLQDDADQTLLELGDRVGLSQSAVQRRLGRLRSAGLLRSVAVLDPDVSLARAVVLLSLAEETRDTHADLADRLRDRPEVQQAYAVSGRFDYAVVILADSVEALHALGNRLFKDAPNVRRYETLFVLDAVKTGAGIPARLLS